MAKLALNNITPEIWDEFLTFVEVRTGPLGESDPCWWWIGPRWFNESDESLKKNKNLPYGEFRGYKAPRVSYVYNYTLLERGEIIRHVCNNSLCVKPLHLTRGSHKDNVDDVVRAGHATGGRGTVRLTEFQVIEILKLCSDGKLNQTQIGDLYGVTRQHIGDIMIGRRHKSIFDRFANELAIAA